MSSEVDLVKLLRTLRRRRSVIASIVIAVTALVMVSVYQLTPLYTASTQVKIDTQHSKIVDFDAVMAGLGSDSPTIDTETEILKSRTIARRVVQELSLLKDPEFNPSLRSVSFFSEINPIRLIGSLFPAASSTATPSNEKEEEQINQAIDTLIANEDIRRRGLTYVIDVSYTSASPARAAQIANAIADVYIVSQLEAKFDATKQANDWLSSRLEQLRRQLEASERAVELYKSQNGIVVTQTGTLTEQQLSELNAQLILARTDRAEKQARYGRARQILQSGGSIESVVDVMQSTVINDLRKQQAELARKQGDLSAKYGPRHPAILNLESERRDLESQIQNEVQRIVASLSNEAMVADTRVNALQKSLDDLQHKSGENDQAFVRLNELQREAAASRTLYESFLNRFKETSQQEDLQNSDARIVARAAVPTSPSFPKKGLFAAIAFGVSLVLGVGVAFLLDHLDNGVQTGPQLESMLTVPHLVSIPKTPREKDADGKPIRPQDYVIQKPLSGFSESLRGLRSALALSNVDKPPRIILFTSALPDEGKTTTAVSFARAAGFAGVKTLLIDCDLRHPSVHRALNWDRVENGLVECLANRATIEEVIRKDGATGLDILPVASGAANPPDLLGSAQMRRLLEQVSSVYDLVVIDSAPVLPVADTRVLALLADKTVFIVKWDTTPRDAALSAIKELRSYNVDLAGAVLAQVDTSKLAKYGYGGSEGYYYGKYRHYYAD
ncbi:GumC family protein [Parvibaculum sp.]|uniref:GumC family protein n=1 Tax=Parvibaculum sp. TaxID=2024848 RepID=UPI002CFF5BE9|nr:polysaccharide biosynthesis tyrosine autokinase [Parvibaculum sp.]HUD51413.1 polysaccharide biosynthesis tyrosine autokinase [Parvibaculum sp.]